PFTEQHILSELLKGQLEQDGFSVDQRRGMSEGIQFDSLFTSKKDLGLLDALFAGKIDCCVNYTGNIWVLLMGRHDFDDPDAVLPAVSDWLEKEHGVLCLGSLGFQNAYGLAMQEEEAQRLGITTIEQLAEYSKKKPLKIGGDLQFFGRPEWGKVV